MKKILAPAFLQKRPVLAPGRFCKNLSQMAH
jgi:hypothetical protein